MNIYKIMNRSLYKPVDIKNNIELDVNFETPVTMMFNCTTQTKIYLDGEFLISIPEGLNKVVAVMSGKTNVSTDSDECYMFTQQGEPQTISLSEKDAYTQVMQKQERDPAMERLMMQVQTNTERRLAQQRAEFNETLARELARAKNANNSGQGSASTTQSQATDQGPQGGLVPEPNPQETGGNTPPAGEGTTGG